MISAPTSDSLVCRQNLALTVLGVGALFSLLFHLGTNESWRGQRGEGQEEGPEEEPAEEDGERKPLLQRPQRLSLTLQWKCWLRQQSFYQAGGAPRCKNNSVQRKNQQKL